MRLLISEWLILKERKSERERKRERQCLDTLKIATSVLYKTAVLNCFLIGRSSSSGELHRSLLLANTTKSETFQRRLLPFWTVRAHLLNISPTQTLCSFASVHYCTPDFLDISCHRYPHLRLIFSFFFDFLPFTSVIFIHHHYIILNDYLHHHNHHTTVHTSLTSTHLLTAATAERK